MEDRPKEVWPRLRALAHFRMSGHIEGYDRPPSGEGFGKLGPRFVQIKALSVHRNANDLPEGVNYVLRPRDTGQVAMNDDAVEAMTDKRPQLAEQLDEYIHGRGTVAEKVGRGPS